MAFGDRALKSIHLFKCDSYLETTSVGDCNNPVEKTDWSYSSASEQDDVNDHKFWYEVHLSLANADQGTYMFQAQYDPGSGVLGENCPTLSQIQF